MTTQQLTFDRDKAAVLIMDFTTGIVENAASDPKGAVERAAHVLAATRRAGVPVIYVVPGGPDRPPATIHPGVQPVAGEPVVVKERFGAFSTTGLDTRLRQMGKDTLVLLGVATSGCVLSTARWAFDLGYKLVIVEDACSDPEPEVHRALTQQQAHPKSYLGLWRMGQVTTAQEFSAALA